MAKIFFFANVVVRNEIAKPSDHPFPLSKIVVTTGKQSAIMAFKGQWIFGAEGKTKTSSLMSTHLKTFGKVTKMSGVFGDLNHT